MEYIGIKIETADCKFLREKQLKRLMAYQMQLNAIPNSGPQKLNRIDLTLKRFLRNERNLEQRIYGGAKRWEKRHPIMAIVVFALILEIYICLCMEIILEALYKLFI